MVDEEAVGDSHQRGAAHVTTITTTNTISVIPPSLSWHGGVMVGVHKE